MIFAFLLVLSALMVPTTAKAAPCLNAFTCNTVLLEKFVSSIKLSATDIRVIKKSIAAKRPVPIRWVEIYAVKSKKAGLELIKPLQQSTRKKHGGETRGYFVILGTEFSQKSFVRKDYVQSKVSDEGRKICFKGNKLTIKCGKNQRVVGLMSGEDITKYAGKFYLVAYFDLDLSDSAVDMIRLDY